MIEKMFAIALYMDPSGAHVPKWYLPPPQYDKPFPGEILLMWEPEHSVRKYCPDWGVACTIEITEKTCTVVINEHYRPLKNVILRHENGHCNGWRH